MHNENKLTELGSSGYEIVTDEPDIRKWKVINADRKILGVVDELLIDRQLKKVRYLVLDLQGKPLNLVSRKVLIPIGVAEFDEMEDLVVLPTITLEQLATLPEYKSGKLTFDTERKIRNVFIPSTDNTVSYEDNVSDDSFYNHEHFDDRKYHDYKRKAVNKPLFP
ncbi:MAG TPA: PRC-barrel domain-containing protein [Parafilimonas sp.]|jgi:hypothetical protein